MRLKTILVFLVCIGLAFPAFTQEDQNTQEDNLVVLGALGFGDAVVGMYNADPNDPSSGKMDLGAGTGIGFDIGCLYNYSILGFELSYLFTTIGDLEIDMEGTGVDGNITTLKYKYKGSGNYWALDPKIGLKLFTEPGDMGYFFLFSGVRVWNSSYSYKELHIGGGQDITQSGLDEGWALGGIGWIAGFRDFSTYPVGDNWSIAVQLGLWVDSAPAYEMEVTTAGDTTTTKFDSYAGLGIGYVASIGVAFEKESRMSFNIGVKADVVLTLGENNLPGGGTSFGGGAAGTGQYFITFTKGLSL